MDHETARCGVLDAIPLLASKRSEKKVITALWEKGYDRAAAAQLTLVVPSALAWPLCRRAGLRNFPDHFVVADDRGREIRVPVADLHYFTAALRLGIDTFENGWLEELPRRVYEQVVRRSAELDAVGKTLEQGGDLSGSTMQALMIYVKDAEAFVRSGSVG